MVSNNKTLKLRGGHDQADNITEGEDGLQDLGMTDRSDDLEDLTVDQNLNCWAEDTRIFVILGEYKF